MMVEHPLRRQCYAGYKAAQRPVRIIIGDEVQKVVEVEDRWYSPGETFFRVRLGSRDRYVLRHVEAQDIWLIQAFRTGTETSLL